MNKRLVSIFFLVLLLVTVNTSIVSAHTLKTVGSIGAVIHVDPDDEPHAENQSTIFLEFHDREKKFTLQNCNCTVEILKDGKKIYSQSSEDLNLDGSSIGTSYIFPSGGIYQVKIDAKPQKKGEFKPFQIVFDVRVLPAGSSSEKESGYLKYLVPSILSIAGISLLLYYFKRK